MDFYALRLPITKGGNSVMSGKQITDGSAEDG